MTPGRLISARRRAAVALIVATAGPGSARALAASHAAHFAIPASADQLIVVSSPTPDPPAPGYLASLRTYERAGTGSPWRRVLGPWPAETGSGHLLAAAVRREGDHATPIGVFGIGDTIYGNQPKPAGLGYAFHRLACGDWWDEDPYSSRYNQFVHVACGVSPAFASWSEPLWTETLAYPYLAVIQFNLNPIRSGATALGSGIFLHSWVGGATNGCVAIHEAELVRVLRWLKPSDRPVVEIGTNSQVTPPS